MPSGVSRRAFLRGALAGGIVWPVGAVFGCQARPAAAEVLYNGIRLPAPWPPRLLEPPARPLVPPYIADPPAVIPIDVGRQLFVDDFLIEETTLTRVSHTASYHPDNPVLSPEEPWESVDGYADRTNTPRSRSTMVYSDGVFYDSRDHLFKMWYMGGYLGATCYATSTDGLDWERPVLDVVPGTNIVLNIHRDSSTVWLDRTEPDPAQRFKMAFWRGHRLELLSSADGIHWHAVGVSDRTSDRSTFFFNPFRQVWVYSLRDARDDSSISNRFRRYREGRDFASAARWSADDAVAWVKADSADFARPETGATAELYNLDCVAYESILLGLFTIWRGETGVREKINEVAVGFSRDGFHWSRPDRRALLPVSETVGSWNWANVQSAGGCCLIVGDRLHFYVSGRTGIPGTNLPGTCSTGLATLRRDGFVSMDHVADGRAPRRLRGRVAREGDLITRPLRFSGRYLFVNVDATGGTLRVELLDREGRVIAPFALDRSIPIDEDGTRVRVRWQDDADVGELAGEVVRFRFSLTGGRLYAFWVSPWATGESRGYPAAGGPEFSGATDQPPGSHPA